MRNEIETAEIERHKYFLSEKAGHDVGWELAERDWIEHHSGRWEEEQRLEVASGAQPSLCDSENVDADRDSSEVRSTHAEAGAPNSLIARARAFLAEVFTSS